MLFYGCYLVQVSLEKEITDLNGTSWINKGNNHGQPWLRGKAAIPYPEMRLVV